MSVDVKFWSGATCMLWGFAVLPGCSTAPAVVEPPPPKVTVQHPEVRELVDYDEYNGWMAAKETVEVRARVRGHIMEIGFEDGQFVKEGQMLFQLDPSSFEAELARAQEQKKIYEAQLDREIKEENRQKALLPSGASTKSDVEKAEANRKALQAQVESAAQEIKRREVELSYTTVKAAISGRISRAYLTVGNLVNAGGSDPLLTTIVSVDPMQVYFDIDERALQRYMASNPNRSAKDDAGQPKKVTVKEQQRPFFFGLETETGYPHQAVMDFAENKVDSTTGTIQVRGEVANPEGRFVAGSRVRIRVPVSAPYQARLVSDTAVLTDQEKRYLLVVDKTNNNTVVRRDVQLGRLLDDGMRVILGDGVSPGDFVIVLGLQRARVNYPVEPLDAEARPVSAPQAGAGAEKPSK